MGKIKATQKITVAFQANTEERADDFVAFLKTKLGIEFEYDETKNGYVAYGSEEVTGWYTPEVRYSKNGDGNPAILELDDAINDDYLYEIISKYRDEIDDENIFSFNSWNVELENGY